MAAQRWGVLRTGVADHQRGLRNKTFQEFFALSDLRAHIGHVQQIGPLDLLGIRGAAIGEDHHMVVQGDGVIAGGADAVGGGGTGEEDRIYPQPPQQKIQFRVEKGGVPGLDDLVILLLAVKFRGIFHGDGAGAAGVRGLPPWAQTA